MEHINYLPLIMSRSQQISQKKVYFENFFDITSKHRYNMHRDVLAEVFINKNSETPCILNFTTIFVVVFVTTN